MPKLVTVMITGLELRHIEMLEAERPDKYRPIDERSTPTNTNNAKQLLNKSAPHHLLPAWRDVGRTTSPCRHRQQCQKYY
jgi:hypothetical protein